MRPDWAAHASTALAAGPTAMVTVLAAEGSAPRGAGTRMIVSAAAQYGTIGGGRLEHVATEQARAILAFAPGTWRIQDYPLGPMLGQCCGGRVRLLIERLDKTAVDWLTEAARRLDAAQPFEVRTRFCKTSLCHLARLSLAGGAGP